MNKNEVSTYLGDAKAYGALSNDVDEPHVETDRLANALQTLGLVVNSTDRY